MPLDKLWRKAECRVLRDHGGFTRAVVVKGKYAGDWEWFAAQQDGLSSTQAKARGKALEAIANADRKETPHA